MKNFRIAVVSGIFVGSIFLFPDAMAQNRERTVRTDRNRTHTYSNNTGVTKTDIEYRGEIIFTENETDVEKISSGGFIKFSKRSFGKNRTIILEAESDGAINREYYEGRKELPFEPEGRKWMASVLPEIIRTTGIGAEGRVAKFYSKGGINAVLDEIESIQSNYIQGIYYNAALNIEKLKGEEIAKIALHAGNNVSSSYELSQLFIKNDKQFLSSENGTQAMILAVSKISSNYDKARVYKKILENDLSGSSKKKLLEGVATINSNYEKSGVLQHLLRQELSAENVLLVLSQVDNISSSYEQSKVLKYLIDKQDLNNLNLERLLVSVAKIRSDYEKTKVMRAIMDKTELTNKQIILLAKSSEEINSDYEQSKLLRALITDQNINSEGINAILDMTKTMSSSYEQSKLLSQIIDLKNFEQSNLPGFLKATQRVKSGYEQSKILSKLIKNGNLPKTSFSPMLKVIDEMSSNYEKSKLLAALGPMIPKDEAIRTQFMEVSETLSDYDYGKVMRSLNR